MSILGKYNYSGKSKYKKEIQLPILKITSTLENKRSMKTATIPKKNATILEKIKYYREIL